MKILKQLTTYLLLPLLLGGAFFTWSLPRITSDYNFNADELIYLERSKYAEAYIKGDFGNKIWTEWGAYDQPQLVNYLYSLVPGDRSLIDPINSPCGDDHTSFYNTWSCLDGVPLSSWPASLTPLKEMVVDARTLATAISALVIATTYYLGLIVAGPITGVLATLYLGWFSFFKNLATMAMMDQLLLLLTNIGLILILRKSSLTFTKLVLFGLIAGLAFATKFSAAIPFGLMYLGLSLTTFKSADKARVGRNLTTSGVTAFATFFLLNSQLWPNPVRNLEQMLTWRAGQISNQRKASPASATLGVSDQLTYTSKEVFSLWNKQERQIIVPTVAVVAILGTLIALTQKGNTRTLALLTLGMFIVTTLILPIKWNRYVLPLVPLVSVIVGYTLTHLRQLFKLATPTIVISLIFYGASLLTNTLTPTEIFILTLTALLIAQGALVTLAMLYRFAKGKSEENGLGKKPMTTFSLIIPARNEAKVIGETIQATQQLDYPKSMYEVIIPVRSDDYDTIASCNQVLTKLDNHNVKVLPIDGDAFTKPYSLNVALHFAKHDLVGVFDAEDEPQTGLLRAIDSKLQSEPSLAAVQAPVQLINVNSSWYASLNCLEYYFWFQSVLPFLFKQGITPLGGNTVFFKKEVLDKIGGWDESCLTEDAEIGIRLAANGHQAGILTDSHVATLEEAPADELGVVKQRSRWDQGFLQVLAKGNWRLLSSKQKLLTAYTLTQPMFRHLSFINMLVMPVLAMAFNINVAVALISFIPSYFLILQWGMYLVGLHDLGQKYRIKITLLRYVTTILYFYPYQALLSLGTFRGLIKLLLGDNSWDKTAHSGLHRAALAQSQ